jgi:hypothetical protein
LERNSGWDDDHDDGDEVSAYLETNEDERSLVALGGHCSSIIKEGKDGTSKDPHVLIVRLITGCVPLAAHL